MMTEICGYLKNWFNRRIDGSDYPKFQGKITLAGSTITCDGEPVELMEGQYFRILGSALNEGVFLYPTELNAETFDGEIWSMAVPEDVKRIDAEVEAWIAKYGNVESPAMSPYNSESFGGYSYSKGGSSSVFGAGSWKSVFADRLTRYKKL